MEFFIELVFEFVFEIVFDLGFDKSVPYPIRMLILSLFTVFFLGIGGALLMGGIASMTRNIAFALILSTVGLFVIFGYFKLIKRAKKKASIDSNHE